MIDFKKDLFIELYRSLTGITTAVWSIVPDDVEYPYIHMLEPTLTQIELKDNFRYTGTITIKLSTKFNVSGSLVTHFSMVNVIKNRLKPNKTNTIDIGRDVDMIIFNLQNEGDEIIEKQGNKIYITTIVMYYEVIQSL